MEAIIVVLLLTVLVLLVLLLRRESGAGVARRLDQLARELERAERAAREDAVAMRAESARVGRELREELAAQLKGSGDSLVRSLASGSENQSRQLALISDLQRRQLEDFNTSIQTLTARVDERLETVRATVEGRLAQIQEDNARKLDAMRETVGEKLHGVLEQRLGESFRLVSERLEVVHKGLGEMQQLASGVGDLKRVLTNVKARGGWGEVQLGALLEQMLTADQYARNVRVRAGSNDVVEFAVRLPGRDRDDGTPVWLPIDAKFPQEDYLRLMDALEAGDLAGADAAGKALEVRIRSSAVDIATKYLDPPATTDFALMFLPTEGLYAEVIRRGALVESIQRECRVVVAGPTTLAALLNSLQMGFRTLAIERRSSEVWKVLSSVKTEFGKFGEVIDRVHKKLDETTHAIEQIRTRQRVMQRKLKEVEEDEVREIAAGE